MPRITTTEAAPPFAPFKGWEPRTLAPGGVFRFSIFNCIFLESLHLLTTLNPGLWFPPFEHHEGWGSRFSCDPKGGPTRPFFTKDQRVGQLAGASVVRATSSICCTGSDIRCHAW